MLSSLDAVVCNCSVVLCLFCLETSLFDLIHIFVSIDSIQGGELFERIINEDYILTERECVHFMRQLCDGVAFMHTQSILHLDLKPENILCVTPNSNEIKIIDFGLARVFDPSKKAKVSQTSFHFLHCTELASLFLSTFVKA